MGRSIIAAVAALAVCLGAAAATLPDLPESYIFSPSGQLTPLHAGLAYQASAFPLAVRVTPPDGGWTGAQWKQNLFTPDEIAARHLTCSSSRSVCAPPYFGWVAIAKGGAAPEPAPRALILVLAGYSATPSVAATVTSLRTRGKGAVYGPATKVRVAGFPGVRFDGQVTGPSHVFVPFTAPTHKATAYADGIVVEGTGHPFRFVVVDVRGKTVVLFVGTLVMSPAEFEAFLPQAERVLGALRFPKGG